MSIDCLWKNHCKPKYVTGRRIRLVSGRGHQHLQRKIQNTLNYHGTNYLRWAPVNSRYWRPLRRGTKFPRLSQIRQLDAQVLFVNTNKWIKDNNFILRLALRQLQGNSKISCRNGNISCYERTQVRRRQTTSSWNRQRNQSVHWWCSHSLENYLSFSFQNQRSLCVRLTPPANCAHLETEALRCCRITG